MILKSSQTVPTKKIQDFYIFIILIVVNESSHLLGFILSTRPLFSTSTVSSSSSATIMGMMLREPMSSVCFSVIGKPSNTYLECQISKCCLQKHPQACAGFMIVVTKSAVFVLKHKIQVAVILLRQKLESFHAHMPRLTLVCCRLSS